jgi:hypothetical protein
MFWEGRSASDRLYHLTSLNNLNSICKENKFNLSYSGVESAEQFKVKKRNKSFKTISRHGEVKRSKSKPDEMDYNKNFYFSVARSIYSAIFRMDADNFDEKFIIELDGSKLADRYEIIPVSYYRNAPSNYRTDEMEDRVISNKPYIENSKRYIIAIHAYLNPRNIQEIQEYELKTLKDIASMGYTVYLYKNQKDIKFLKRERAEVINGSILTRVSNTIKDVMNPMEASWTKRESDTLGIVTAAYDFIINPTFKTLVEILKNDPDYRDRDSVKNPTPSGIYYISEGSIISIPEYIINKIGFLRTSKKPEIRKQIHKFSELQRKTSKSLYELATNAYEKVKKELSDINKDLS